MQDLARRMFLDDKRGGFTCRGSAFTHRHTYPKHPVYRRYSAAEEFALGMAMGPSTSRGFLDLYLS
jgi:hypothetical protein